jgi:hypothetical protein
MDAGFEKSSFVILIEDDTLVGPDGLVYFQYARETFADDPKVFTVSGYSDVPHTKATTAAEGVEIPEEMHFSVGIRHHYTPWVWGTWQDRYNRIRDEWYGWDVHMNHYAPTYETFDPLRFGEGLRGRRYEVFPVLSRANNIGFEGGKHADRYAAEAMKDQQYLTHWAGNAVDYDLSRTKKKYFHQIKHNDDGKALRVCQLPGLGSDTVMGFCGKYFAKKSLDALKPDERNHLIGCDDAESQQSCSAL